VPLTEVASGKAIDELALYNPLLDAESVESHYRSQYRRLTEQA
jgi:hypothetical protein